MKTLLAILLVLALTGCGKSNKEKMGYYFCKMQKCIYKTATSDTVEQKRWMDSAHKYVALYNEIYYLENPSNCNCK